jgi:hypothetical protein
MNIQMKIKIINEKKEVIKCFKKYWNEIEIYDNCGIT